MAGTLVVKRVDANAGRVTLRQWVFTPSGNYAQGGGAGVAGETLNFNVGSSAGGIVATNPTGKPRPTPGGKFNIDDFCIDRVPAGYGAVLEANAVNPSFANVVLRFFTTANTEVANGAYPAALIGDVVINHISDKKNG